MKRVALRGNARASGARLALTGLAAFLLAAEARADDLDYTTLNFGDADTFLTGIRGNTIVGNYLIPDSTDTGGLIYDIKTGTFAAFPVPTDSGVNFPDATVSSPYGPSFGSQYGILRAVGSYQTTESAPYDLSYLYDASAAPGANLTTLMYPTGASPTLFTIAHSTFGDEVVGNYDTQLDTGNAFIYHISTGTYTTNNYPGAVSTTAYGVWGDMIAGGYSPLGSTDGLGLDKGYIYNQATDTWTSYDHPGAVVTHFEGISGAGRAGEYNLVVDWAGVDEVVHAAVLHIAANGDETWIELGVDDNLTSANSIYGDTAIGVYVDGDGKVNGYTVQIPGIYNPISNDTTIDISTANTAGLTGIKGDDIVNSGTIHTSGANSPGIRSNTYGVVTNTGTISVTGPGSSGVELNGNYGTLLNGGTIKAAAGDDAIKTVNAVGTAIVNAGIIDGRITAMSGDQGRFENSGVIGISTPGSGVTDKMSGVFVQTTTGTLGLRIGADDNDALHITGAARLDGTLAAAFQGGGLSNSYTLLTASDGLTGTFDTFTPLGLASFVTAELAYTVDDVTMDLTSHIVEVAGLTPNEAVVGGVLDNAFNSNGSLPGDLGEIFGLTDGQVPGALNALSGEVHASLQTALLNQAYFTRQAVLARLRQFSSSGSDATDAAFASVGPQGMSNLGGPGRGGASVDRGPAQPAPGVGATLWAQAFGAWGSIDGNSNASAVSDNLGGVVSGVDMRVPGNWRVGMALGYTQSNVEAGALVSSAEVDGGLIAAYAGTTYGAFNVRLGATYGFNNVDTKRNIGFPNFFEQTRANYNANTGQVFGEVGYAMASGGVAFEPFAGLAWAHIDSEAFGETGGVAALNGTSEGENVGYSTLGVRAASSYPMQNGAIFIPHASVAWQAAFGDLTPAASLAFASISGSNFTVVGVPLASNAALVDAGADLRINADTKIGVSYSGQLAKDARDNAITGNVLWNF